MPASRTRPLVAALLVATAACTPDVVTAPAPVTLEPAGTLAAARKSRVVFGDDFASYGASGCLADGATIGAWLVRFNGYGCTATAGDASASWLSLSPMASGSAAETHAALVLGPAQSGAYTYAVSVITDAQLRANDPPNPWEVAWVVWSVADDDHFYYFIPKPNGWELGKRDPAYPGGQRFLATGSAPAFPLGAWRRVEVVQSEKNGTAMTIAVDGRTIVTVTDRERPYGSGRIGVYSEDAAVRATNVIVTK